MTQVKRARRTATTLKVRSKSEFAISRSRDPYHELMLRLFQEEETAMRGQKFPSRYPMVLSTFPLVSGRLTLHRRGVNP